VHEAYEPNAFVDLFDSEGMAGEDGRDIDFLAVQADATAGGDQDIAVVEGVGEVWQAAIGTGGGGVELAGTFHGERLVRSFDIEFVNEGVEAGLLLKAVHAWRTRSFLFQGEVHALVSSVLLRMAWLDAFALLDGLAPHLMVTDPPYGVEYDPSWRHRAGVNRSSRVGKVRNDECADWEAAWALFPGSIA
jgi:hypothetical protein